MNTSALNHVDPVPRRSELLLKYLYCTHMLLSQNASEMVEKLKVST